MRIGFSASYERFKDFQQLTMNNFYGENKKLAMGRNIQFGNEDSNIFIDSLRLTYEEATIRQVKDVNLKAKKFSDNSDSALNQFSISLDQFKTKLLFAANEIHTQESASAIANELKAIRKHLLSVANTSINGQYLFAGADITTKPVAEDGTYRANSKNLNLEGVTGNSLTHKYNVSGYELFFGEDKDFKKRVSTNIQMFDQTKLNPAITKDNKAGNSQEVYLKESNTIRDMVGDIDDDDSNDPNVFFYVSGRGGSGETFKKKIEISSNNSIDSLLEKIGEAYGNDLVRNVKLVDVKLNDVGQIEVTDRVSGRSALDFHIVGAVDYSGNLSNVDDVSTLGTNYDDYKATRESAIATDVANGMTPAEAIANNPENFKIVSFIKSGLNVATGTDGVETIYSDRLMFSKNGEVLSSNIPQIKSQQYQDNLTVGHPEKDANKINQYATDNTKLIETAGTLSLDGTVLDMVGVNSLGANFTASINLSNSGSTFTINGTTYTIYKPDGSGGVGANEITYKQLNDVIGMVTSGEIPTTDSKTDYDNAVRESYKKVDVSLDQFGKISIINRGLGNNLIEFGMYDSKSSDFNSPNAPVLAFNANSAITIDEPHISLFQQLDEAIVAVENMIYQTNGDKGANQRNRGVQYAIEIIDHLQRHTEREHTKLGAQGQALQYNVEKAEILEVHTATLKSEILDTDIALASAKLNQVTLNYQALLTSTSKISGLSLVNYMR